jgi:hypothetical protein
LFLMRSRTYLKNVPNWHQYSLQLLPKIDLL